MTTIDHMFIINTEIKSAIIKTDVSDHLPIFFIAKVNVFFMYICVFFNVNRVVTAKSSPLHIASS